MTDSQSHVRETPMTLCQNTQSATVITTRRRSLEKVCRSSRRTQRGAAVVEFAFKPLPLEPPIFRRRADWFRQNRAFKIDRARRELGYEPRVDLDTGLERTYEWYRENGYL